MPEQKSRGYYCLKQPILESYRCYFFEEGSLFKVARKLFLLSCLRSRQVVAFLGGNCSPRSVFLFVHVGFFEEAFNYTVNHMNM